MGLSWARYFVTLKQLGLKIKNFELEADLNSTIKSYYGLFLDHYSNREIRFATHSKDRFRLLIGS